MTTAKPTPRSFVVLKLPRPVPPLISVARAIVQAMTGNPLFPTPDPTLATVTAAITDLDTAETAAKARTRGAAAVRNDKRAALVKLLEQLKAYIQKQADANLESAAATIQSAGVSVKKPSTHGKRVFAAKVGAVIGSVKVTAERVAARAGYEWQYSTDGGKTWVSAPTTLQAKTTVTGLTPGATVSFRYRTVTKTGEGDWSQPTAILVH
jgi:hypothetical protein